MEPHRYRVSGCELVSDVPLALPQPVADGKPTQSLGRVAHSIRLRLAPVPRPSEPIVWDVERRRAGHEPPWLSVARLEGAHLLRAHGYADFWVSPAVDEVLCAVEEGLSPEALEHLLLDGILPQLLHLVGFTSFHASAVADARGRVAALMGASGSGKSTLAGSFAEAEQTAAGAVLVGDDTVSLSLGDSKVTVYASYPRVRLWADSAGVLFDAESEDEQAKAHIAVRSSGTKELTLAAVFALVPNAAEPYVQPLGRRDAVVELAKHLDRLLPRDRQQLRREFDTLDALTKIVPVARLGVPHDYDRLGEVRALVSAHAFRGSETPGCSL